MKTSFAVLPVLMLFSGLAHAELKPENVHVADAKKNQFYVRDGLVTGGDQAINEVVVKDIRRAPNIGFERIVIDLEGTRNGEAVAIDRPPFYQVAVTPDEKRIVFTIWGKPKLTFNAKKVLAGFKKSAVVQNLQLLPTLEDDSWSFVMDLKGEHPVEIFELSNPVRIIADIRIR